MSYILDALKKDEVEPTPAVAVPPAYTPPTATPRRWWPWVAGAAVVVNLGIAGWLLLGSDGAKPVPNVVASNPQAKRELAIRPPTSERTRQRTSQPLAQEPAPAGSTGMRASVESNAQPQVPTSSTLPRRTPVRERTEPTRPAQPAPRATRAPAPAQNTSPPPVLAGGGRVLSPEQAAQLGIGGELMAKQTNAAPSNPRPNANQPASQSPSQPAARPSTIAKAITVAELPAAARSKFPSLEFSSHIFADDPSMRAVVVNDQRLTEGQQLGELILRSVTEDGVIFGFRSHLVVVSVVDLWAD